MFCATTLIHVVMHGAFRPCAVVEIPKDRIDAIFAYGIISVVMRNTNFKLINCSLQLQQEHYEVTEFMNRMVSNLLYLNRISNII